MKTTYLKLFTGSAVLATLLISGCGTDAGTENSVIKQPHNTSKLNRTVSLEKDWTWNVGLRAAVGQNVVLYTDFWEDIPDEIVNFQHFIDIDSDQNTGFSGSNGWEINGADYLIENGDLYKSSSNTEWSWEYIGNFQTFQHSDVPWSINPAAHPHETVTMIHPMTDFNKFFNTNNFKVMIEVYDENWVGDYSTVTGIDVEVSGATTGGTDLDAIEKKIRTKHNAKFTTVTTIDFAPNRQEAIVAMINKWTGKDLYVINVLDTDTFTIFAKEYKNKFVYKTIVVKDNAIVEFQIKEDDGLKYKVVYDYGNNTEISKTLIEGNPENVKKVLIKKETDSDNNGEIDNRKSYKYDIQGNITSESKDEDADGLIDSAENITNEYNKEGELVKTIKKYTNYSTSITTEYNVHGHNKRSIVNQGNGEIYITNLSYTYADDGRILTKVLNYVHGGGRSFELFYNEDKKLIKTTHNNMKYLTFSYNENNQVATKTEYDRPGRSIINLHHFIYDEDGDKIQEQIDQKGDGSIDKIIYYIYEKVSLPN